MTVPPSARVTPGHLRTLHLLADAAAIRTSRSLSRWLRVPVGLTVTNVSLVPFSGVPSLLGGESADVTGCLLPFTKGFEGTMLLALEAAAARRLVSLLLKREAAPLAEWGELEKSAVQETGNIVATAFANVLAGVLDLTVSTASPVLAHDFGGALVEELLLEEAKIAEQTLVMQADFSEGDYHAASAGAVHLVLLPSPASFHAIMDRLGLK